MMKRMLVAAVAACAAAGTVAETTGNYVPNGLIAIWDGYENDGAGGHATSLTEWKDTSGRYSFVFNGSGITIDGASLVFSGASGCYATLNAAGTAATFDRAKNGTMEIVFKGAANQPATCHLLQSSTTSGISAGSFNSPAKWIVSNVSSPCPLFDGRGGYTTLAVHYTNGGAVESYANAELLGTDGDQSWGGADATTYLGARASKSSLFKGEICAIRLYSTSLTPEQIAANRAVDVKRFVEGDFNIVPGVSVQGFPEEYATSAGVPKYGFFPCADGDPVALSAPETVPLGEGTRAFCAGWKLYDGATSVPLAESDAESRLACKFTYEKPVKLVWQWKVQYRVTAAAAEGLTVTPAEQWVDENGEGMFTVSGMTGSPYWTGDGIVGDRHGAQVTVRPAAAGSISVSEGAVLDVPGAFATIAAALEAAQPGDVVALAAGTYTAANSGVAEDAEWMFTLEEGIVLKGAGTDTTILDGELAHRVLRLKADSKAQDLTVANAHSQGGTATLCGYALDINGGVVENCVVTNGFAADKAGAVEHFVYLGNGGTIAGTQVCGTTFKQQGWGSQGGVVYVSSGTVTNCQVFANSFRDAKCSALTLDGADALAVDCDVYGNTGNGSGFSRVAGSGGASILSGGGRLVRCRVAGNTCNSGAGTYYAGALCVAGGNALIDRCVITNNASGFDANLTTAVAGGVLIYGKATLRNTLVAGNRLTGVTPTNPKTVGGGVLVTSKDAAVENCTIVGNTLDGACCEGAGMRLTAASSVVNCIVWSNGGTPAGSSDWISGNISNVSATVTTCWTDSPLFEDGSYRLSVSSPCIDAGTNQDWMDGATDLAGDPRIRNGYVDIGAFESEHIPVYECSVLPTSGMLGPAGGSVPLKAVFTMPAFVESVVWTVTAATGTAPAGGEGADFNLVCPPGVNTYTVSLKVTWNGEREATAPEPAVVRVVEKYDVAPGDDLATILASLTGLSSDNPVTVNLAEGTYTAENSGVADDAEWMYVLEEGVILKGAGVGRTILDGCLAHRVLRLKAGSKAKDFTVANAHSQGSTVSLRGYALDVNGATVENCVVTNGLAADTSGGWKEHCVFLGNGGTIAGAKVCGTTFKKSGWGSQGGIVYVSSGTVTNCQVFANTWRDANCSALTLDGADALAVDCDVYGNTGTGDSRVAGSGGASILSGGGKFVRCCVTGNTCNSGAGGYYTGGLCVAGGDALIDRCVVTNNASGFDANLSPAVAGGVLISGKAVLRNSLVADNRLTGITTAKLSVGGGVLVTSKDAKVESCTIADNTLDGACCEGAGLRLKNASSVVNCIVWQNGGTPAGGEWMLGNISNETASVTCTCATPLVEGEGNTAEDPKLKAKKGYLIRDSSPCVDKGDPTGWTASDVDLLGKPRLRKGAIDMGCYQATLQGLLLMVK